MAGVYISYPFCSQKCTYCNFASGVMPRAWETEYAQAVQAEISAHRWQWTPETVYLGGGTPSRMPPERLRCLLELIPGRPWREATLEAAPGSLTPVLVESWRDAGINRVSLGVQSFVPQEIGRTGRKHCAAIVRDEVGLLRQTGMDDFNIDLIAGLPGQTAATWEASLDWVEQLEAPHVSIYMLEVDEDSRLGKELLHGGRRYGAHDVPGEADIVAFYERGEERLRRAGIERYEISNFARPGRQSRHNLKYWRREPYIGFGADAHSFDGCLRWQNHEEVESYLAAWRAGRSVRAATTEVDAEGEQMFLGLRLSQGVRLSPALEERFGAALDRFAAAGLLDREDGCVRLTPRGMLLSNEVFQEFVGWPAGVAATGL